ncbi:MAG: hypothetical protein JXO49_09670 [Deltaproteobacteria bacterium]|nr:hypothetical protein [Candidatus Anaeroferrophillus wilburensis]MBN2889600.1 hypothetical protein [Deltaproteobacteria bacterium]
MVEFIIPSIMPNPPVSFGKSEARPGALRGKIISTRKGRRRQRRYSLTRHGGEERRKFREKRRTPVGIDNQSVRIITLQVTADYDLDSLVGKEAIIRVLG